MKSISIWKHQEMKERKVVQIRVTFLIQHMPIKGKMTFVKKLASIP